MIFIEDYIIRSSDAIICDVMFTSEPVVLVKADFNNWIQMPANTITTLIYFFSPVPMIWHTEIQRLVNKFFKHTKQTLCFRWVSDQWLLMSYRSTAEACLVRQQRVGKQRIWRQLELPFLHLCHFFVSQAEEPRLLVFSVRLRFVVDQGDTNMLALIIKKALSEIRLLLLHCHADTY